MWVSRCFPGDVNKELQDVQHSLYAEMIVRLFTLCRDRYLAAASLLRTEDQLSALLRPMSGFDHPTLQDAHDQLAAAFRFRFIDSFQLLLGENDSAYRCRLEDRWREYFSEQAQSLATDDEFTRAICTATAKANQEPGNSAENWLHQFLKDRYPLSTISVEC